MPTTTARVGSTSWPGPRMAARAAGAMMARHVSRLLRGVWRLAAPLRDPQGLLVLGWMVGLFLVGAARMAYAADGGIIDGPDLAQGAPPTLYEAYDFAAYQLTVKPDSANQGFLGAKAGLLEIVGFVNNLIMWLCLGILYGALTLLEWFLNLSVYQESAPQIDTATQMVADNVFWPLIGATVAIGAFIAYTRWRGEGRGFLSDMGWVVAAGVIAVGFAAGPSQLMNDVDGLRQDVAAGVISGAAQYTHAEANPTGFVTPEIGGDPQVVATRTLVDSVWNTFGATAWCYAQFHELDICEVTGAHALANDEQWQRWMTELDNDNVVPEFGAWQDWIRGQDMTRTAYLLMLALITIPMALMLLRLVVAGLIAAVGFLLMLIVGLVFLTFWPIPGWFRDTGTKYWLFTLGMQLQALFVTVVIAAVMVVSTVLGAQTASYGFFIVAVLNLGLFAAAVKARAWLEMLTTVGGGGSLGFAGALMARSAVRTAIGTAGGVLGLGAAGARALASGFVVRNRWGSTPGFSSPGPSWNPGHGGMQQDHLAPFEDTGGRRWADLTRVAPTAPASSTPALSGSTSAPPRALTTGPRALPPGPGGSTNDSSGPDPGSSGGPSGGPSGGRSGPPPQPGGSAATPSGRPNGGNSRSPGGGTGAPGQSAAGASNTRSYFQRPNRGIPPSEVELDPTVRANVARTQERTGSGGGRVWVDRRGDGISSLDPAPPPRPARHRDGAYRITRVRRGRRQ
ncbi:hypothetical protein [Pseudonocardia kunmingensis]|uniref:TrbL/VirB6 plasmid conjugal transfer protein n=1 Tax=Pseudonocardia kunmingensis TaxID=630975 RepID=A0A543CX80_9PSEU|nr:hypothetical protein [Pseudonocardia kunmingensis]TQM01671.1 hypothetical protein FB558_8572 [Pseudonocardia kunmingensis]